MIHKVEEEFLIEIKSKHNLLQFDYQSEHMSLEDGT